jgi:hypothetical protein
MIQLFLYEKIKSDIDIDYEKNYNFQLFCVEKRKVISIVVPTIILAMLLSIGYYLLKGRGRKNRRTILRDNCKYYIYMEEK